MKVECKNCGFKGEKELCNGCKIFLSKAKRTYRHDPFRTSSSPNEYSVFKGSQKCNFFSLQTLLS
jgi:hypothetical protein